MEKNEGVAKIDFIKLDPKLKALHLTWDSGDLISTLNAIRKNNNHSRELMGMLEHKNNIEEREQYIQKLQIFYKNYTFILLHIFIVSEDDLELLLAMYGFLKGFEHQVGLGEQKLKYWKNVYNSLLEEGWQEDTVKRNIQNEEKRIIEKLAHDIIIKIINQNGALNILDEVPEELEYPAPRLYREDLIRLQPELGQSHAKQYEKGENIEDVTDQTAPKFVPEQQKSIKKKRRKKFLKKRTLLSFVLGFFIGFFLGISVVLGTVYLFKDMFLYKNEEKIHTPISEDITNNFYNYNMPDNY